MADRRMFHGAVVGSDTFLDLPVGAQALYFHLGMRADDDGFVNGPRQVARTIRRSPKDLALLVEKNFLLEADGVMIIRHWLVANSLKIDRLKPPRYPDIAARLYIEKERTYTFEPRIGLESVLDRYEKKVESIRNSKVREGKVREGKVREGKVREDKLREDNIREASVTEGAGGAAAAGAALGAPAPYGDSSLKLMGGTLGKGVILLSDAEQEDLLEKLGLDGFDRYVGKLADFITKNGANVNNHYATILRWWQEDRGVLYE